MRRLEFYFIFIISFGITLSKTVAAAPAPEVISYSSFKSAYSAGNEALKKGHFQEAAKAYMSAEGLANSAKGRCDGYNAAGWALMKAKKWPEAKDVLVEAVTEDSDSKVAQKNLGFVCFNLYEYGFAGIEELKNAVQYLEASGENEELLDRAKSDLSREESYAQATPGPEPVLTGKSFKSVLAMADVAQADGKYALALKILKRAALIAHSTSSKALIANRQGMVLLDDRKPREAVVCFETAVKDKPKQKVFLNNQAYGYWVVYDSGKGTVADLKKAVDTYYRVNSMDSTFHNDMFEMALEELKEIDPASAIQYTVNDETSNSDNVTDPKGSGDDGDSNK